MTERSTLVLVTAAGAQGAQALINSGLPAIGPQLQHRFDLSLPMLGVVLDATLLGMGLALPGVGWAVDRWGARGVAFIGAIVAAAGFALAGLATSAPALIAGLLVAGAGGSVIPIAGASALLLAYPGDRRAWAFGVRQTCVPIGGVVAAVLLPVLASLASAQAAVVAGGAVTVAACLAFGIVDAGGRMASERLVTDPDAPALIAPRPGPALRDVPDLPRLLVVTALYVIALEATFLYTVPAVRAAGLSALVGAIVFLAVSAAGGVARVLWGRLADRHGGTRRTRTLAEVGLVSGAGALLFALVLHSGSLAVVPAAMVLACGTLGWNALVYVLAGELAPPALANRSVAVTSSLVFLLAALCAPLLGVLAEHGGWDALWLTAAAFALVGARVARGFPAGRDMVVT